MNTPLPRLIGMVHLLPLPGSPKFDGDRNAVLARACSDALALADAGFNGILIENYGDAPFYKERRDPVVIAEMTHIITELRRVVSIPMGVQVLRNDAIAALAIAGATGAEFIRVNVLSGVMVTDQGIIEGQAAEVMRYRSANSIDAAVFADVFVKHAAPLGEVALVDAVRDTVERSCADAIVISGAATGAATKRDDIRTAKSASCSVPVIVGSGATEETIVGLLAIADAVIIGTSVKQDGLVTNPVDPLRARSMVKKVKSGK